MTDADTTLDEYADSQASPHIVMPSQYERGTLTLPELELLAAVYDDALAIAFGLRRATLTAQRAAIDWIYSNEPPAPGDIGKGWTFLQCCDYLNMDPDAVREQVERGAPKSDRKRQRCLRARGRRRYVS
jgi:hypothetical protein